MHDKESEMIIQEWMNEWLLRLGGALLLLLAGYIAIRIVKTVTKKLLRRSKVDEVLYTFILHSINIVLWAILLIAVMAYVGIPVTSFLTVLGAAGVAVALALRDSLANFAGGILIMISKPFNKGDYIEDLQTSGLVDQIDLLYTRLITFDNKVITIPNGKLANSTIINNTKLDTRRVDCVFRISLDADLQRAKEILQIVAEHDPRIMDQPAPIIGVAGLVDHAIELDLRAWCKTEDVLDVRYFLEEGVKMAFDEAGIVIPYQQIDVNLRKRSK